MSREFDAAAAQKFITWVKSMNAAMQIPTSIPEIRVEDIPAKVIRADGSVEDIALKCAGLTADERLILQEGCLMNYYAAGYGKD